jgi:NAD+ diphosphatase
MFVPSPDCIQPSVTADLALVFRGADILLAAGDTEPGVPTARQLSDICLTDEHRVHLGTLDGQGCMAATAAPGAQPPAGFDWRPVRSMLVTAPEDLVHAALLGLHLLEWRRTGKFCGACGTATRDKAGERARACPACGQLLFPRISPAVITAVLREDCILLAHNKRFHNGMYSLVAGFVEPGEGLEDTVQRETREEVGVEVDDIHYFGSQPWPFPDSLMLGFTARHVSGDIRVDNVEIDDAQWFTRASLPEIPSPGSISRRIIDWFVASGCPAT